jgi:hypothetical protein
MVLWINESSTFGVILQYAVANITGDLFLALLVIFVMFLVACWALKIPIQFLSLLLLPLAIGLMAYDSQFLPIGGTLLFIVAFLLARAWIKG